MHRQRLRTMHQTTTMTKWSTLDRVQNKQFSANFDFCMCFFWEIQERLLLLLPQFLSSSPVGRHLLHSCHNDTTMSHCKNLSCAAVPMMTHGVVVAFLCVR